MWQINFLFQISLAVKSFLPLPRTGRSAPEALPYLAWFVTFAAIPLWLMGRNSGVKVDAAVHWELGYILHGIPYPSLQNQI